MAEKAGAVRSGCLRILAASDRERQGMERRIHDGAQQRLVALAVSLSMARRLMRQDPDRAESILEQAKTDLDAALEEMRDLARTLFPALLAHAGLAAALEADLAKLDVPTTIEADGAARQRFDPVTEAVLYFAIREAIRNAARHAPGSALQVVLQRNGADLSFSVTDGGPGFDPAAAGGGGGLEAMADRIEALGGTLNVDSAPGKGTAVSARVRCSPAPA